MISRTEFRDLSLRPTMRSVNGLPVRLATKYANLVGKREYKLQNYIRSIGFSMYKKKNEVKELLDKIQRENIASARISVTTEKERLWVYTDTLRISVYL